MIRLDLLTSFPGLSAAQSLSWPRQCHRHISSIEDSKEISHIRAVTLSEWRFQKPIVAALPLYARNSLPARGSVGLKHNQARVSETTSFAVSSPVSAKGNVIASGNNFDFSSMASAMSLVYILGIRQRSINGIL